MSSSIKTDMLTGEQRHAGYSVKVDGDHLYLYLNGEKVDSFEVEIRTILQLRQVAQNHMEMQKSGVEFMKP